jgi:transcription elongation factor GreA
MIRNPITPRGYAALLEELKHHKEVLRPRIVRDIEEARAHGDISENSEYEDAKERQSLCEGRIAELEHRLSTAEVIDVTKLPKSSRVVFGTTVLIANQASGEERRWTIVGETEADVESGKISLKSPLGAALVGRSVGDEVVVPAPGGRQVWDVIEVHYE